MMKHSGIYCFLGLLWVGGVFLFGGTSWAAVTAGAQSAATVSLIQLIANPEQYDGQMVRVIGYVIAGTAENDAVYLSREDGERVLMKNAVALTSYAALDMSKTTLSQKYCLVEGVFSAKYNGPYGLYSGSLENITRLQMWGIQNETVKRHAPSKRGAR